MHRSSTPTWPSPAALAGAARPFGLGVTLASVLLAGCAGSRSEPETVPEAASAPGVVESTAGGVPIEEMVKLEYARIAPGDRIDVRVLSATDLSGTFLVLPDGKINFPLVGTVQAGGYSVQEFDTQLSSALNTYFRNIDVTVNVTERADRFVYVLGQVNNAGRFQMRAGDRVLHALGAAGGMTNAARENGVVLIRRTPDGRDVAYKLEFDRLHRVVAPQDVLVQPDDIVFVPKGRLQTFTEYMSEIIDVVQSGAITALVLDDLANIRTRALSVQ